MGFVSAVERTLELRAKGRAVAGSISFRYAPFPFPTRGYWIDLKSRKKKRTNLLGAPGRSITASISRSMTREKLALRRRCGITGIFGASLGGELSGEGTTCLMVLPELTGRGSDAVLCSRSRLLAERPGVGGRVVAPNIAQRYGSARCSN